MPKYLFTNDLRISELPSAISSAIQNLKEDGLWNDKSAGNNTATLQFYFNLHKGTDIVSIAESDSRIAIRNFIMKFQFPNTRTKESFNDCIGEKTLLAPYRVIVGLLLHIHKCHPEIECWVSLWEVMYFIFASDVSKNPKINYESLSIKILRSRTEGVNLESKCSSIIQWKQSERQLREMLNILCYASKCFKYVNKGISFYEHEDYLEDKEYLEQILAYNKIWYPSDINNFELAQQEYTFYMDSTEYKYSVIQVDNTQNPVVINADLSNSIYRPYITSAKSKPFLLLAGISGTGKSRIVRELAKACWDVTDEEYTSQRPRNFEMVQVKPNWHDSSELIGYVSRVSGTPVFVAGDFLRFVARAWEEPEIPYFLCLDEMNLAPVEQYFAEYLSVIESRNSESAEVVTTDPILKKSNEDWFRLLTNDLTSNDDIRNRFLRDGICIPQNLIVIGTVNMDETTFSFSRKVLDRAMTIEMNEVDLEVGLTHRHEQIGKLTNNELIGTAVQGIDVYNDNKDTCDLVIDYLKKVNSKLEGTPFKIAYRTRNEFLLYVVNNLPYNKLPDGEEDMEEYVIARALDEITNMKILSRIEGDETKVSNEFLESLEGTIKKSLEEIFDGPFAKEDSDEAYKSISLAKLDEMKTRLKSSGYTSFWS